MPRSKKDVMKAMPEQLLKDYLRTHHCTSSPHGVWTPEPRNQSFGSPCEVCAMMPEALVQLEKMRKALVMMEGMANVAAKDAAKDAAERDSSTPFVEIVTDDIASWEHDPAPK